MDNKQKKAVLGIFVGISALIGCIFLFWMVSTMVEFQTYTDSLYRELVYQYGQYTADMVWNSPEVQNVLANGYMTLFTDKAVFFIPSFIVCVVLVVVMKRMGRVKPMELFKENF
jgi:hypothetical protein